MTLRTIQFSPILTKRLANFKFFLALSALIFIDRHNSPPIFLPLALQYVAEFPLTAAKASPLDS